MTIADLRRLCDQLPDDAVVCVGYETILRPLENVEYQAGRVCFVADERCQDWPEVPEHLQDKNTDWVIVSPTGKALKV